MVYHHISITFRWPSILCNAPSSPEYVILDNDGDPHSYHVEFLGTKHSIAWVHHEKITAYGNLGKLEALETCSQGLSQVSMNRFKLMTKVINISLAATSGEWRSRYHQQVAGLCKHHISVSEIWLVILISLVSNQDFTNLFVLAWLSLCFNETKFCMYVLSASKARDLLPDFTIWASVQWNLS